MCLTYKMDIMAVDGLPMQGAMPLTAMLLPTFSRGIPVSAPEGLP